MPTRRPGAGDGPGVGDEALRYRAKAQIRTSMRALRAAIPAPARAERSRSIVQRLAELPLLREGAAPRAMRVASFWPMLDRGEVDLTPLHGVLRGRGAHLYYPFMRAEPAAHGFARVDSPGDLADRGRGFFEPPLTAPVAAAGELDVIVVPALAVAPDGHRIGYGAGFYDGVIPAFRPPATILVVAFDFQLLGEIPATGGDARADGVITDTRVIFPVEPARA